MRRHAVFCGLVLILSACDNYTAPPAVIDPTVPVTVALRTSSSGTLTSAGDTRVVTAVVKNGAGAVIESPVVEWSSTANSVATVANTSIGSTVITATGDGTATITARIGSVESSTQVVVRRTLASVTLTAPTRVLEFGSATQVVATALDARHNAIPGVQGFTFFSDNPTSAFVQANGVVTALFKFPQIPDAAITATLMRDGVTTTAHMNVIVGPPAKISYGALMLTEFVVPLNPPTRATGLAFINRASNQLVSHVLWADLASPVTRVQIRGPAEWNETGGLLVELGPRSALDSLGHITNIISSASIESQNGRPPISLDSLRSLLCSRRAYVDVRTARHPNGEIRGQMGCVDDIDSLSRDLRQRASKF